MIAATAVSSYGEWSRCCITYASASLGGDLAAVPLLDSLLGCAAPSCMSAHLRLSGGSGRIRAGLASWQPLSASAVPAAFCPSATIAAFTLPPPPLLGRFIRLPGIVRPVSPLLLVVVPRCALGSTETGPLSTTPCTSHFAREELVAAPRFRCRSSCGSPLRAEAPGQANPLLALPDIHHPAATSVPSKGCFIGLSYLGNA